MSGHDMHGGDDAHDGGDTHHEPETTSDDFPADEPRSPAWLPLLGAALLLVGIFALVFFSGNDEARAPDAGGANAAGSTASGKPAERPAAAP